MIVTGSLQTAPFPKIYEILGNNLRPRKKKPSIMKHAFKQDRETGMKVVQAQVSGTMTNDCKVLELEELIYTSLT